MARKADKAQISATHAPTQLMMRSLERQKAEYPDLDVEGVLLRQAAAGFIGEAQAIFEKLYAPMGSHVRFTIVNGLATLPELQLTPKSIADLLGIRSATLAPILAGLEKEGWIRRVPHDTDKRSHYVVLALGAKERWRAIMRDHIAQTTPAGEGMSAAHYADLRASLDAVLAQLRRLVEDPAHRRKRLQD